MPVDLADRERMLAAHSLAQDVLGSPAAADASDSVDPDTESLALHHEVARMMAARPSVVTRAVQLLQESGALHELPEATASLVRRMVGAGSLDMLLRDRSDARAMRAASPLPRLVPEWRRAAVVQQFVEGRRRLARARPLVAASLRALRGIGVRAEVVGSFASGAFGASSDVDYLILDSGGRTDGEIVDVVARNMRDIPFDIVLAERMSPTAVAHMRAQRAARQHARSGDAV